MSHENSIPTLRNELAAEYGRRAIPTSNKGFVSVLIKTLVVPFIAMLIILTGAAFAIANFSPAIYTQAKEVVFTKIDFERLTGQTDSVNKEILDNWLILNLATNSEKVIAQDAMAREQQSETPVN